MRPIYGCPENFRESPSTPTVTFPEICNGLLFRSDPMNVCTTFEVPSFTRSHEITGGIPKWSVPGLAHAFFTPIFLMGFCLDGPCECISQF